MTRHYVYVCNSLERNVTLGVLYGYKAILQVLIHYNHEFWGLKSAEIATGPITVIQTNGIGF